MVVAAGNAGDGPSTVGSPGAAEKAITVRAVAEHSVPTSISQHSDGVYLAPFSSRGPTLGTPHIKPDIASPGVTITSADAGTTSGYATFSGTSMATPYTAGTIALALQADSSLTSAGVKNPLQSTATDRGPTGKDNHWGWGLIDGFALVSEAPGAPSYSPTNFPSYSTISGSVSSGGLWSHTFEVTDLTVPIVATILLDVMNRLSDEIKKTVSKSRLSSRPSTQQAWISLRRNMAKGVLKMISKSVTRLLSRT